MGLTLGVPAAAALGAPKGVWIGVAIMAGVCLVAALWLHIREGRIPASEARQTLWQSLDRLCRELDNLLGIVQSDIPGYSVTKRRGELAAISRKVRRVLNGRPDLRALYDSPRPEAQIDGQLMDHDERIFEAELEYRRNMLVEAAGRLVVGSA